MPSHTESVYIMGTTGEEYERLRRQAQLYEPFATAVFDRVRLGQGMSCLDVGCGPGEVMRLMAERVGPAGRVVGTDIDEKLGPEGLRHLHAQGHMQCSFIPSDVLSLEEKVPELFDVVYARLVVIHLDDPLAGLKQMYQRVKPGGHLVVQDMHIPAMDSDGFEEVLQELRTVISGVWDKTGRDQRAGLNLPRNFIRAAIGAPDGTEVNGNLMHISQAAGMLTAVYKSLLPLALKLDVTSEERSQRFLADTAAAARNSLAYVLWPLILSVWKRKTEH
jgi:ubiquinone/menaquinone biosynthesis C-methylase UbiE